MLEASQCDILNTSSWPSMSMLSLVSRKAMVKCQMLEFGREVGGH